MFIKELMFYLYSLLPAVCIFVLAAALVRLAWLVSDTVHERRERELRKKEYRRKSEKYRRECLYGREHKAVD